MEDQSKGDAGDLSSNKAIVFRILAMLEEARKATNGSDDVDSGQLKVALKMYIEGLSSHPQFKEQRLLGMEQMLFSDSSATRADSTDLEPLLPLLHLAEIAYEGDTDLLTEQLKEHGYDLHKHEKEVKAGEVGYYIALNHEEKVMVIGVKGTSSFADALTDCVAVTMPHWCVPCCPYTGAEQGREIRCHEGMLTAANKLCDDLEDAIKNVAIRDGYMTKIVGHSLGAGTAALVGILLRTRETNEILRDPKCLHVWAFACPAVLDMESARESKSFITSVVNKSDVVPRCSIANLKVLTTLLCEVAKDMQEKNDGKRVSGFSGMKKANDMSSENSEKELPIEMLTEFVKKSQSDVDVENRDHLYVPGEVVLLYEKKQPSTIDDEQEAETTTGACIMEGSHAVSFSIPASRWVMVFFTLSSDSKFVLPSSLLKFF
jgi:hypothetical protein